MCGILGFFDLNGHYKGSPEELKALLQKLSHRTWTRGPDGSGYYGGANWGLAHERLAIMDPEGGQQPIVYEEEGISLVANGEIYNHKELIEKFNLPKMRTGSDSEPLIQLYQTLGNEMCKEINGIFGFVVTKNDGKDVLAARDHCGIKPLYIGYGYNGEIWFSSELKAIVDQECKQIEEFPAGHYWTPQTGFVKWYNPVWDDDNYVPVGDCSKIRQTLHKAVER